MLSLLCIHTGSMTSLCTNNSWNYRKWSSDSVGDATLRKRMLFTHNLLIFSALLTNLERLHLKLLITAVLQTLSYNNHLTVESFHINSTKYEYCLFRLRQFFFYSLISTSQWELPVTLVCSVVSSSAGSYSHWALWSRPVSDQRTVAKRFFQHGGNLG